MFHTWANVSSFMQKFDVNWSPINFSFSSHPVHRRRSAFLGGCIITLHNLKKSKNVLHISDKHFMLVFFLLKFFHDTLVGSMKPALAVPCKVQYRTLLYRFTLVFPSIFRYVRSTIIRSSVFLESRGS